MSMDEENVDYVKFNCSEFSSRRSRVETHLRQPMRMHYIIKIMLESRKYCSADNSIADNIVLILDEKEESHKIKRRT